MPTVFQPVPLRNKMYMYRIAMFVFMYLVLLFNFRKCQILTEVRIS